MQIFNAIKLNAKLSEAEGKIVTEGKARMQAEANLKDAEGVIANLHSEKEALEKTLKELNEKIEASTKTNAEAIAALKKEYEDKLVATSASVATTVNKELATIGVEAKSIKLSQETLPSKSEVLAKLDELSKVHGATSKEATAYYSKYKAIVWSK